MTAILKPSVPTAEEVTEILSQWHKEANPIEQSRIGSEGE